MIYCNLKEHNNLKKMSNSYHKIKVSTRKVANKNTVPVSVWLKRFLKVGIGLTILAGVVFFFASDSF